MSMVGSSQGVEVAVYDFGGHGPDVLFAHATGLHAHVWEPVVAHLRDRARCVGFDARGHGRSTPPVDDDFSWSGIAEDVRAAIAHLGLRHPFAVGHSMGGAVLVLTELAEPGTFERIWCYEPIMYPGPSLRPPGEGGNSLADGARRRREVFPSRDAAVANYAAKPPWAGMAETSIRAYVDEGFEDLPDGTVRLRCRAEHEARTFEMSANGAFDRLGEVRCPVTVACGSESVPTGPDMCTLQVGRLPDGTLEVHEGLGHFGPLEDPARIARSIAAAFGL